VTWSAVPAASGAVVQRSTDPAFGTSVNFNVNNATPTFIDTTAAPSTTYYYRVQSTGVAPASGWSTPNASVTTPATPLVQIAGLAAAETATAPAGVTLSWTGQPWAATYEIQRATNTAFTTGLTTITATSATLIDTSAALGVRYYYRARATQPGVNGIWSARLTFTPAVPPRPNTLTPTTVATGVGTASVTLTWTQTTTAATVGGFTIQRSTDATFTANLVTLSSTVPATDTTYVDSGLARNTRYYYRIESTNGYGASTWRTANIRTPL
jgi:hypothetical protein